MRSGVWELIVPKPHKQSFQDFPNHPDSLMALLRAVLKPDSQRWPFEDAQSENDISLLYTVPPHEARPAGEDSFEYTTGAGPLDVTWKLDSQTLSKDARHVEYNGPAHLCNACMSAIGYLAGNLRDCIVHEGEDGWESRRSVVHHQNLMALFAAANEGCHLCKTVWGRRFRVNGMATAEGVRTEFCWNTTERAAWDGGRVGDARLLCNIVDTGKAERNKHTWDMVFRFQLWPSPMFDRYFEVEKSLGQSERGNTRSSRPMALRWMEECKSNADGEHSGCQSGNTSWYPTRFLDLSMLEKTDRVPLVVSELLDSSLLTQSEYITLSHCWGAWGAKELPVLTLSNINDRVDYGMDISLFPPTFRDAIEVAKWFNSG
ncbi:MAG: hypothetical protein Q9170_001949 [Blastenia crenularia]